MKGSKTVCSRGHKFTPENTKWLKNGLKRCLTCRTAYMKQWESDNPRARNHRAINLAKNYGITETQYEDMFQSQHGLCAICHRPETIKYKEKVRHLVVDHDHKSGKVRKLLCNRCNVAIGYLEDSAERARAAAVYLDDFGEV